MKYNILFIVLALCLNSCFSYKTTTLDPQNLVSEKKYKIKRNDQFEKVRLISSNEKTIIVKDEDEELIEIPKEEITKIKKRKFSVVKTSICVISGTFIYGFSPIIYFFITL